MFASLALALITCAKAPPAERPSARAAEAPSVTEAPAVPVVAQGGPVVVRAVVAEVSAFGDDPRDAWALVDGSAERALAGDGGPVTLRVRFERPERLETVTVRGPYDLTSAEPTVAYDYAVGTSLATAPYWVRVRNKDSAHPGDPVETVIFVDGLGRVIQTKQDAEVDDGTGSTLVGRTVSGPVTFDHRGRPARVGQPVFDGGPVGSLTTFLTVPEVHATVTAYDVVSRTTAVTDPAGASVQTVYTTEALDGVTRLAATTVDPVGHERTVFTDVRGATVAVRERNTIDGVLTALVTRYTHDPLGRLTKVVDAQGHGTDAVYDSRGLMVSLDNPDTGLVTWRYTLAGDLAWRQTPVLRAEGEAITYARTFHRLDRVEYPHSAPVEHAYGAPGAAYNAAGRLVSTTDASGTTSYRYGALGEVTHTTHALVAMGSAPALTAVVKHTYDSFGRVQSIAYPDGADVTYEYDAGGRLRRVLGTRNGSSFTYVDRVTYTEFGERRSIRYGNGVETTYQYDPARRWLSSLNTLSGSGLPLQQVGYGLRADGNITAMWGATAAVPGVSAGGSFYQGFTYDDLNQLTDAVGYFWNAESSRQYAFSQRYDAIGNVTSKAQDDWLTAAPTWMGEAQSATTYAQSYAYGGVRPHAPTVVGSRSFSYDADGNQTGWSDALTSASRTITWDEEDRVTEVSTGGASVTFRYNGDGQRTHKVSSGATSVYVGGLYTVRNGVVGTRHVYAGDQRIASTVLPDGMAAATENTYFYHPNHLQSTHLVTNDAGAVTEHTEYFPFGETWIDESSTTERVAYRFTGKEIDAETGLYYFGARYYDPRQSQWISADPILASYMGGEPAGGVYTPGNLGLYGYVWNRPLQLVDPNGTDPLEPHDRSPSLSALDLYRASRQLYSSVAQRLRVQMEEGYAQSTSAGFSSVPRSGVSGTTDSIVQQTPAAAGVMFYVLLERMAAGAPPPTGGGRLPGAWFSGDPPSAGGPANWRGVVVGGGAQNGWPVTPSGYLTVNPAAASNPSIVGRIETWVAGLLRGGSQLRVNDIVFERVPLTLGLNNASITAAAEILRTDGTLRVMYNADQASLLREASSLIAASGKFKNVIQTTIHVALQGGGTVEMGVIQATRLPH